MYHADLMLLCIRFPLAFALRRLAFMEDNLDEPLVRFSDE